MLYENVVRLCKEHGISIHTLEQKLEIGNGTIGKWKEKAKSPRVDTVKKIADFFCVKVNDLLDGGQKGGNAMTEKQLAGILQGRNAGYEVGNLDVLQGGHRRGGRSL